MVHYSPLIRKVLHANRTTAASGVQFLHSIVWLIFKQFSFKTEYLVICIECFE